MYIENETTDTNVPDVEIHCLYPDRHSVHYCRGFATVLAVKQGQRWIGWAQSHKIPRDMLDAARERIT